MKSFLRKLPNGTLAPESEQDQEALRRVKVGNVICVEWKQPRNYKFHKKMFALLNFAFDAWEPVGKEYKGEPVAKNFDQFRNDVTVLSGFYETAITLRGETRLMAKSISFANMSQEEFERLYDATINVILSRVLTNYTREDLDRVVEELLRFA